MTDTATTEEAAEPAAAEEKETVSLANKHAASAPAPEGEEQLVFEPDVAQEIEADHAHMLLSIKDAGFYIPGEEEKPFDPNPTISLLEAERLGRTAPSPFETTETMQAEQDALDEAEVELAASAIGPTVPPRYGRGSSAASWQDYAEQLGHHPPEGLSRDAIIRYLESQGVLTQERGATATILGEGAVADEELSEPGSEPSESEPQPPPEPTPEPGPETEEPAPAPVQTETNPEPANSEVAPG